VTRAGGHDLARFRVSLFLLEDVDARLGFLYGLNA
jgi:hypothetical protein